LPCSLSTPGCFAPSPSLAVLLHLRLGATSKQHPSSLSLTHCFTRSTARREIRWWWGLRCRLQGLWGLRVLHGVQDTGGHEGVPAGLVVGTADLVDGGNGVAASGELYTPTSLHFVSNK
jgi:hypothetical protein